MRRSRKSKRAILRDSQVWLSFMRLGCRRSEMPGVLGPQSARFEAAEGLPTAVQKGFRASAFSEDVEAPAAWREPEDQELGGPGKKIGENSNSSEREALGAPEQAFTSSR